MNTLISKRFVYFSLDANNNIFIIQKQVMISAFSSLGKFGFDLWLTNKICSCFYRNLI